MRVHNVEYVDAWRERQLDFDHVVSPEEESAHAISRAIGLPAARQTDVFADGPGRDRRAGRLRGAGSGDVLGAPLREARIPADSRIAGIVRARRAHPSRRRRGAPSGRPGDRDRLAGGGARVERDDGAATTIRSTTSSSTGREDRRGDRAPAARAGHPRAAGRAGTATRAREVGEALPSARVFNATGFDPEFLERERIGAREAGIAAMRGRLPGTCTRQRC